MLFPSKLKNKAIYEPLASLQLRADSPSSWISSYPFSLRQKCRKTAHLKQELEQTQ